jgi:hypothetical protein
MTKFTAENTSPVVVRATGSWNVSVKSKQDNGSASSASTGKWKILPQKFKMENLSKGKIKDF